MEENDKKKTPSLANWLISKLIKDGLHEEFFGDLEEIYQDRILTRSKFYATLIYWIDVLHLLTGFTSFKLFKNQYKPTIMLQNYLKVAVRNSLRNKAYSLINLLSLAVGMGVCLTIYQYVYFELSFDKFHDNFQNTYRVLLDKTQNGVDQGPDPYTSYAFGITAKEEIPEIKRYVRVYAEEYGAVVTNPDNNKPITEEALDMFFVDRAFLTAFNFPLKTGDQETALDEMYNIIITEKTAHKYFGSDDPMGKTLKISGGSSGGDYIVTGVLEELPLNSHLQFEFLLPLENLWELGNGGSVNRYGGWGRSWFVTYLTLDESANPNLVRKKLDQLLLKYKGEGSDPDNVVKKARFQPIADIHLKSDSYANADFVTNQGDIQNVWVFALIAFFILFIAWVNFINLSTARAMQRAKEVGIRKSIGAYRKQLIGQFMTESILVNTLAALLAIAIALFALPILNRIIGKELALSLLQIPEFWVWFLVVIVFGSLLSGLYPAFVLSAFKPVSTLGTNKTALVGNVNLRKGLIVFQFLTSLLLIAGTYLVYQQITFMKSQELGMDMEKILVVKGPEVILDGPKVTDGKDLSQIRAYHAYSRSTFQAFKTKVASHHSIAAVAGSEVIPGQVNNISENSIRRLGEPAGAGQYGRYIFAGLDFPETYGLEFMAGSSFTPDLPDDEAAVINEEAVRIYGLGSPQNALQEKLMFDGVVIKIVGVVKNFHWQSLRDAHTPYLIVFFGAERTYISFKMNVSDIKESLAYIKSTYDSFYPDNPFDYFFLEDAFNRQYQADVQFGNLFFAFTALAIFIASIGLLALVSFSATLRIKEIGIRKVLGAGTGNLMMLLSREFLMLISIAIVLAIPAILYWGGAWLDNYAFRTDIGFDLFIIPALVLVIISVLTVSYRTYSTAKANPVESLRAE